MGRLISCSVFWGFFVCGAYVQAEPPVEELPPPATSPAPPASPAPPPAATPESPPLPPAFEESTLTRAPVLPAPAPQPELETPPAEAPSVESPPPQVSEAAVPREADAAVEGWGLAGTRGEMLFYDQLAMADYEWEGRRRIVLLQQEDAAALPNPDPRYLYFREPGGERRWAVCRQAASDGRYAVYFQPDPARKTWLRYQDTRLKPPHAAASQLPRLLRPTSAPPTAPLPGAVELWPPLDPTCGQ